MQVYVDNENHFVENFNPMTGFYIRSGVLDVNGKDTGVDPFMRDFPALIDVGIMERCVCSAKCTVDCYQKACDRTGNNMSLDDYISILDSAKVKFSNMHSVAQVIQIRMKTLRKF